MLTVDDYEQIRRQGDTAYWRRPGKDRGRVVLILRAAKCHRPEDRSALTMEGGGIEPPRKHGPQANTPYFAPIAD